MVPSHCPMTSMRRASRAAAVSASCAAATLHTGRPRSRCTWSSSSSSATSVRGGGGGAHPPYIPPIGTGHLTLSPTMEHAARQSARELRDAHQQVVGGERGAAYGRGNRHGARHGGPSVDRPGRGSASMCGDVTSGARGGVVVAAGR
eukprot:scaffold3324_cov371-Prasinococcus_capsulatus_cf.AAC.12